MNQKEKKSESQLVQLVSSLMSGVLLAFGISVLLLFCAAHLVASGTLGETIAMNARSSRQQWVVFAAEFIRRSAAGSGCCCWEL